MVLQHTERAGSRTAHRRRDGAGLESELESNPEFDEIADRQRERLYDDPEFLLRTPEMQRSREANEVHGLYIFLKSGIQAGEFVEVGYNFANQTQEPLQGVLTLLVDHATGDPLTLFVDGKRIRFRALNWIRRVDPNGAGEYSSEP